MKFHLLKSLRISLALGAILVSGAASSQQLEEIVVTAEFREENVQNTPIAITAVTGDMLEARAQTNVYEMAMQSPNVTLKPGGTGRSGMLAYIRGIGQSDFIAALEPGVGVYVDDVYYPLLTGSLLDLLDLERVEILRGPQGTLAGRNSIGGAIRLFSKAPGADDDGGSVSLAYGSYNQVDVRGAGDFTIIPDSLYARIAGASRNREGYIRILDYGCTHPGSGAPVNQGINDCLLNRFGSQEYATGRATVRWLASDDVEVNLIADYLNNTSNSPATTLLWADRSAIEASPANPTISLDDGDPSTPLLYYRDHIFVPHGPYRNPGDPINDPYVAYSTLTDPNTGAVIGGGNPAPRVPVPWKPLTLPPRNALKHWGASVKVDWQPHDALALTSISAYREWETWMTWDTDASPLPITMLDNYITHWQVSQEMRLSGATDLLDYTLGAFYFNQNNHYEARVTLPYAALDFIHGPDPTPSTTWAVFANATFRLSERFNVSAGVRYSDEHKEYTHFRHNPDYSDIAPPGHPLFPVNVRVLGVNGLTAVYEDERTDWRLAADYLLNDEVMIYASAATGYKGGGVNPRPFFPPQLAVFQPETLLSYELGLKSTLLDNTLRLNAAVFLTEYEDIQLTLNECEVPPFIDPDGISAPCAKPANVGNADIQGFELETEWYLSEDFFIDASFSALDFEYTYVDALALGGSSIAPLDMITPYTPETKWSVGLQYHFPTSSLGDFNLRVDASFMDEVYANPTNRPLNLIKDYTLSNARFWWQSPQQEWEIALEALNFTDELYYHDLFDQSTSVGTVAAQPGLPRTYRISAKKVF